MMATIKTKAATTPAMILVPEGPPPEEALGEGGMGGLTGVNEPAAMHWLPLAHRLEDTELNPPEHTAELQQLFSGAVLTLPQST